MCFSGVFATFAFGFSRQFYFSFMDIMAKTSVRSINFSSREENILISLVKKYKYKEEVECKKSDTNTIKSKGRLGLE